MRAGDETEELEYEGSGGAVIAGDGSTMTVVGPETGTGLASPGPFRNTASPGRVLRDALAALVR